MHSSLHSPTFQTNCDMLRQRFPDVWEMLNHDRSSLPFETERFTTAKGHANIFCLTALGKRPWYNTDDIVQAMNLSSAEWDLGYKDLLICIGMGLGYLSLIAVNQFNRQPSHRRPGIIIIEPYPAMFKLAMQVLDLRRLLVYENLQLHVGDFDAAKMIDEMGYELFLGKQRVVSDAASRDVFGETFCTLEKTICSNIGSVRDLWYTTQELGPRIFANTIQNLPSLFTGQTLGRVKGVLRGLPALCVAAGPSLDAAIPLLKRVDNRAVILAVDSAIPALIAAGIRPHMVVTADVREINFRKYRAYLDDLREAILIYAVESNPNNVRGFLGSRKLAVSINNPILNRWLNRRWDLECALPAMATVTHAAVFSAMELDADPIIFVGMDMAFPNGASHSAGAMHHYQLSSNDIIHVRSVSGSLVKTNRPLNDYRLQLEKVIAHRGAQFINTSPAGAMIAGTIVKSLKAVYNSQLLSSSDVSSRLNQVNWASDIESDEVAGELGTMLATLEDFIPACDQGVARIDGLKADCQGIKSSIKRNDAYGIAPWIEAFKEKYHHIFDLLWGTQLKTLRKIEREGYGEPNPATHQPPQRIDGWTLRAWRAYLRACIDSAVMFQRHLTKIIPFFDERIRPRQTRFTSSDSVLDESCSQLATANFLCELGEIEKAEKWYKGWIRAFPSDWTAWLAMVHMYVRFNLWKPALNAVDQAVQNFPDNSQIADLDRSVRQKIKRLLNKANEAYSINDIDAARIYLLEYLAVYPDDPKGIHLKKALSTHMRCNSRG